MTIRKLSEIDGGEARLIQKFLKAHDCQVGQSYSVRHSRRPIQGLLGKDDIPDHRPVIVHACEGRNVWFLGIFAHAQVVQDVKMASDLMTLTQIFDAIRNRNDGLLENDEWIGVQPTRKDHNWPIAGCFATARTLFAMKPADRKRVLATPYKVD